MIKAGNSVDGAFRKEVAQKVVDAGMCPGCLRAAKEGHKCLNIATTKRRGQIQKIDLSKWRCENHNCEYTLGKIKKTVKLHKKLCRCPRSSKDTKSARQKPRNQKRVIFTRIIKIMKKTTEHSLC